MALGASGVAQGQSADSLPVCSVSSADTAGWMSTVIFDLGLEVRHPAAYRRKTWETSSSGRVPSVNEFWLGGSPGTSVTIDVSAGPPPASVRAAQRARTHSCSLDTRSGRGQLLMEEQRSWNGSGWVPVLLFRLRVATGRANEVVELTGIAPDSASQSGQIAMAQSIRLLSVRPD